MAASGVFNNIPEDLINREQNNNLPATEDTVEPELGVCKVSKPHKVTKNKLNYLTNFESESGMEDWSIVAAKTLVGKIRGRKYSSARLQR